MGMQLDYESGRAVVGHQVRLRPMHKGHHVGRYPGTLVEATPEFAVVRPARHKKNEHVPWTHVFYDNAKNQPKAPTPTVRGGFAPR